MTELSAAKVYQMKVFVANLREPVFTNLKENWVTSDLSIAVMAQIFP